MKLEAAVANAFYGKFSHLRECQQLAIEPILSGKHLVLSSGTGSGKTEAVLAPLISRFWRQIVTSDKPAILYLSPTKALINDLHSRLLTPVHALHLRIGIRHGDRNDMNRKQLPHILLTTPESLEVMLLKTSSKLKSIMAIVIDEAHAFYNTQRGFQLAILLSRMKKIANFDIQFVFLSATITKAEHIISFFLPEAKAEQFHSVRLSSQRQIDGLIYKLGNNSEIESVLKPLLANSHLKLLCFANTRALCETLSQALQPLKNAGFSIFTHYSSLSTNYRNQVEKEFKTKSRAICIATSTLELGIDIGDIDCVLLYDAPFYVESFLQKIGRGNRKSMRTNVLCFIPPIADDTIAIFRFCALLDLTRQGIMPELKPIRFFGAIVQQIMMLLISHSGAFTSIQEFLSFFDETTHLDKEFLLEILQELSRKNLIRQHGFKYRWGATESLFRFYDLQLLYGNFPISQQMIPLTFSNMPLGEIPRMNIVYFKQGDVILFGGKKWKIKKIDKYEVKLDKTDSKKEPNEILYFTPASKYFSFLINHAWKMICSQSFNLSFLSEEIKKKIIELQTTFQYNERQIPFYQTDDGFCYYTFAGEKINEAIILSQKLEASASEYTIFSVQPIDFSKISASPEAYLPLVPKLYSERGNDTLFQTLLPSYLYLHEKEQEWLNDTNTKHVLQRLAHSQLVEMTIIPDF
jgi:ATP-dependent Lhr-like helicase